MNLTIKIKIPVSLQNHKEVLDAALKKGVDDATTYLNNAAKNNAPQKTGNLRRSIVPEIKSMNGGFTGTVVQDSTVARYGGWVENGTGIYGPKGQRITPKNKKVLSWKGPGGERIYAKSVSGQRAKYYMKRALQEGESIVQEKVQMAITEAIGRIGG